MYRVRDKTTISEWIFIGCQQQQRKYFFAFYPSE